MTRSTKKWRIGKEPLSSLITVAANTSILLLTFMDLL